MVISLNAELSREVNNSKNLPRQMATSICFSIRFSKGNQYFFLFAVVTSFHFCG